MLLLFKLWSSVNGHSSKRGDLMVFVNLFWMFALSRRNKISQYILLYYIILIKNIIFSISTYYYILIFQSFSRYDKLFLYTKCNTIRI